MRRYDNSTLTRGVSAASHAGRNKRGTASITDGCRIGNKGWSKAHADTYLCNDGAGRNAGGVHGEKWCRPQPVSKRVSPSRRRVGREARGNWGRTLLLSLLLVAEAAADGYSEPMPRNARVVVPSVAHHVTQRGNNRLDVFFVDADREMFLQYLREAAARFAPAARGVLPDDEPCPSGRHAGAGGFAGGGLEAGGPVVRPIREPSARAQRTCVGEPVLLLSAGYRPSRAGPGVRGTQPGAGRPVSGGVAVALEQCPGPLRWGRPLRTAGLGLVAAEMDPAKWKGICGSTRSSG